MNWQPTLGLLGLAAGAGLATGAGARYGYQRWLAWPIYRRRFGKEQVLYIERIDGVTWQIVARPVSQNDNDRNEGGLGIFLKSTDGSYGGTEREIERVAFLRQNSANPDVDFEEQVDATVAKAQKCIEVINELTANAGSLQ